MDLTWNSQILVETHQHYQLLNEAEYDVKNYANLGGCYPPSLKAEGFEPIRAVKYFEWIIITITMEPCW